MEKMSSKQETWVQNRWRPTIAWTYIAICLFDFIGGPIFWTIWQSGSETGMTSQQWTPLTFGAGGLFHLSMGTILGVTSWSRGREKISGVAGHGPYSDSYAYERETETFEAEPYNER